jgi:uncharacterized membrane protein
MKSIASKVALAVLAGAATQASIATPTQTTVPSTTQQATQHTCAKKLGGDSCEKVRCFGISKKGMNDCGTSKHACASMATADNMPSEWIYVLKGNCTRIVGGSLTPPDGENS